MAALGSAFNVIPNLAQILGFSEASLRMLFTPLIGLPLAYIQRTYFHTSTVTVKHLYVLICGTFLAYFNYGVDIIYSAITVLLNLLMLHIIGGTQLCVALSFIFNMGYLVTAYALYSSVDYDVTWTTPQCIITLRMIGLAFDLYDGHKPVAKLSNEQKTTCIARPPSLLEIYAYTYFYGGYFVGPQFPIKRYMNLVHGNLIDNSQNHPPQCVQASMKSFQWGLFYFLVVAVVLPYFPNSYLFTTDFAEASFIYKLYMIAAWGHISFAKYCGIFSLFDAVCIMTGLTYNRRDEHGNALWDACIGAKAWNYEVSLTMKEVIASMNISTNLWAAQYIYKRLKFVGNRFISQLCTILFLAVWHGWYIGYYITFAFELAVINFEIQFAYIAYKTPWLTKLADNQKWKIPLYIVRKLWQLEYLAYPLVSFTFLKWRQIKVVHGAVYFYPYILFFGWPVVYYLLILPLLNRQSRPLNEVERGKTIDKGQNGGDRVSKSKAD